MANNPFALFTLDEKAETFNDVLSVVKKRDAELAAIEAEKVALEVAWAEAIAEDQRRTRWAQRQLKRQQNYGRVYGQSRADQNGSVQGGSSIGSVQGQSRPSSSNGRNNNQVAEWRLVSGSDNNGNAAESTEKAANGASEEKAANGASEDKAANGASEERAEEKAEIVEESEEEKSAQLKAEKDEIRKANKEAWEKEKRRKEEEAKWKARQEEAAIEAKQITLKKYEEAVLSEKRKALEEKAKKLEVRKVTLDQGFENMRVIERKEEDGLLVKLEPETEKLKSKLKKKSDKVQKVDITEFLKDYVPKASRDLRMSNGRGGGGRGGGGGGRGRGGGAAPNRRETNSGNGQAFNKNGPNKGQTSRSSNGGRYQRPTPPKNIPTPVEEFPSLPKP